MASMFIRLIVIAAIVVLPPFTKAVWGQSRLDQHLQDTVQAGCAAGPVDVIIRVKEGHRKNLRDALKAHGDVVVGEFTSIDGVGASVHCQDLGVLTSMPEILSVSANSAVEAHAARRPRRASKKQSYDEAQQAAAARLQAPIFQTMLASPELRAASYLGASVTPSDTSLTRTLTSLRDWGLTGVAGGIGIAVIDSGIEPGPEFENRISAFFDFTRGDVQVAAPSDSFGHGSHVAGLIAGKNVGVAPGARLVGLKVLGTSGGGLTSDVVRAIEFAISNRAALNIHVLNISLGHPIYESAATDPLV